MVQKKGLRRKRNEKINFWSRNGRETNEKLRRRKKRMDLELQKGKFQTAKRLQDEAEKEQNRREKEEAALRKQLALQKQASLIEQFHKRSTNSSSTSHNVWFFNKSNIS
ncbi:hypothetical protein LguiA_007109 [Lonicera macranthoides]